MGDVNNDGWPDLVAGNYVDYDPTQLCYDQQGRQDFCAPKAFFPQLRGFGATTAGNFATPRL